MAGPYLRPSDGSAVGVYFIKVKGGITMLSSWYSTEIAAYFFGPMRGCTVLGILLDFAKAPFALAPFVGLFAVTVVLLGLRRRDCFVATT